MARRTWIAAVVTLAALAAGYLAARSLSGSVAALRSEHSRPAVILPEGSVAVTPDGKTFHYPTCRFVHGPVEMIPAEEAAAKGYVPCVRCMRGALGEEAAPASQWSENGGGR